MRPIFLLGRQVVSTSGNVTGGNLVTAGITSSTGNITGGNILTAGLISSTGNISAGNISVAGALSTASKGISASSLPAGTILQVVTAIYNPSVQFTMTSATTYTTFTSAPSASITLTNSANKVLIIARIGMQYDAADQIRNTIYRIISGGATTDLSNSNTYGLSFHGVSGAGGLWKESMITYTDLPATSSAVTYTWYSKGEVGGLIYPDHGNSSNSIILMEVAV